MILEIYWSVRSHTQLVRYSDWSPESGVVYMYVTVLGGLRNLGLHDGSSPTLWGANQPWQSPILRWATANLKNLWRSWVSSHGHVWETVLCPLYHSLDTVALMFNWLKHCLVSDSQPRQYFASTNLPILAHKTLLPFWIKPKKCYKLAYLLSFNITRVLSFENITEAETNMI